MLEHSYYTVISPEGCASILWRDASKADVAAEALKITSEDLLKLEVIDGIIKEPIGGAHCDYEEIGNTLKTTVLSAISELQNVEAPQLRENRYNKFRRMGVFCQ
jgi:acetyl-CoA carboxylase carboxyl transferase subunit alpha